MKKIFLLLLIFPALAVNVHAQAKWHKVQGAPNGGRYDDMNFTSPATGYIAQSSQVYETRDKGNHWKLVSQLSNKSYYVRSIEFLNDNVGFAGLLYSASPLSGNLFKTTDGGKTWTLLTNMDIKSTDGICGMAHYGNTLVGVGTWSQPAWFYRTDDLGATWKKVDMSALASGLVDCYMLNNDTILASGIADAAHNFEATILKSYDGGNTWKRVYLAPNNNSYCWKMFFRPNGVGLASVEFGPPIIARTTDFGETWTTISVYDSKSSDLGGIALMNDTLGWVTDQGASGTWETHDGGLTWASVNSPVKEGDRMVVLDSITALVSGVSVYKYTNLSRNTRIETESPDLTYKQVHELKVYPNPASDKLNIDAIAGANTFGILLILDEKGSLIQQVTRQPFVKGETTFKVDTKNLPAGNYQLLWKTNELFLTKQFVVVR